MNGPNWALIIKTIVYGLFLLASILTLSRFIRGALRQYKAKEGAKRSLTPVQRGCLGVLLATWIMFVPVYYFVSGEIAVGPLVLRPLLLAVHNTMRVFILDGDFHIINNAAEGMVPAVGWVYSGYASMLYVIAPMFTAGFILSLFKGVVNKVYFNRRGRKRKLYIFSELNSQSIALAESICKHEPEEKKLLVFTEVFEKNEEPDYELLERARNLGAVCMKQDVTLLDIPVRKKGKIQFEVEYFLIGENESENISQASRLVRDFQHDPGERNTKVFVFASSPESEYLIGSIANWAGSSKEPDGEKAGAEASKDESESRLMVRRVDAVEKLIWNELRTMHPLDKADENGVISVLLVGMGKYGRAFFKNLVWFCQACGFRLELNVVDKRKPGEHGSIRSALEYQCPELLELNGQEVDGEACYSVEFFEGVDAESSEFIDLLEGRVRDPEQRRKAERLKRTAFAIVAMGDDDHNIRVAMDLRLRFDRLRGERAADNWTMEREMPIISAVVYDEQKTAALLSDTEENQRLVDYKSIPLHIRFIGNLSVQYDYQNIYEPEMEDKAYRFHSLWVRQNIAADKALKSMSEEELARAKAENEGLRLFLEQGGFQDYELETGDEAAERRKYERFEYFRKSSMARALHEEMLKQQFAERFERKDGHPQICMCEDCLWLKKTEHMRWNAYMRSRGYKKGSGHISRAKLHSDLVPWGELPWQTQIKD